tara:strand:- start:811 stop:1005 length:195 start_codon:yes stop_codon:yes gene_type:complete
MGFFQEGVFVVDELDFFFSGIGCSPQCFHIFVGRLHCLGAADFMKRCRWLRSERSKDALHVICR